MGLARGYKAKYDYVDLMVEQEGNHWRLTLRDNRHQEDVVHDETYATAAEAQEAALDVAQHHINIQHNDTLLLAPNLAWQEI